MNQIKLALWRFDVTGQGQAARPGLAAGPYHIPAANTASEGLNTVHMVIHRLLLAYHHGGDSVRPRSRPSVLPTPS